MTQETKKRIHLVYGIAVSAVSILAGISLIAACLNIYYSGVAADAGQIYTRQIVAESFAKIAIPVYSCLVLVIGGMILNLVLPPEKAKVKPEKNFPRILRRLHEKADLEACNEDLRKAVAKEQQRRKILETLVFILLFVGFYGLWKYIADSAHWGTNSTPSMVTAVLVMLIRLTIPFLVTVFATYRCRKSMKKEIELMRQAAAQAPKAVETAAPKVNRSRATNITRIAILAIGILLVVLGACNEGTKDILTKAVNICTECVGLG